MYGKAEVYFGQSKKAAVEVGGTFSRTHELNITETAEVIALCDDHFGLPHVRFSLISSIGPRVMDCGVKTLAVEAFLDTYKPCEKPPETGVADRDKAAKRTNVTHLRSHV